MKLHSETEWYINWGRFRNTEAMTIVSKGSKPLAHTCKLPRIRNKQTVLFRLAQRLAEYVQTFMVSFKVLKRGTMEQRKQR